MRTMSAWMWWPAGKEAVRVIGREDLWGQGVCDVFAPSTGRVVRVDAAAMEPLESHRWSADELRWRAGALRALWLAMHGEPLAVGGGGVTLLPHQKAVLDRALLLDPVRLAICDEVGLGKTITAGAIAAELRARKRIKRVLVVAPKGVQLQWVAEMTERFNEEFVRVGPEGVPFDGGVNVWRSFECVVTSLDAVKPLRQRADWTSEQVRNYNEGRFLALVEAGWDLVIIDEAHHVAGADESVARHRLARELAATIPNLLLLSATPHSGKSESFRRFLGLLDPAFFHGSAINRDSVGRVVARTEKRSAVDGNGAPLFQLRTTSLETVHWGEQERHRQLYEDVTAYVRDGYTNARSTGRTATGFLMLLMQRLVSSSTPAILGALERRQLTLLDAELPKASEQLDLEEWRELTGEEQAAVVDRDRSAVLTGEVQRIAQLVDQARACLSSGPDPKTLFFLRLLRKLQRQEKDPRVKILVFTEFRATQEMLVELLQSHGISSVVVHGQMGLQERLVAQQQFRGDADVMVSTDAGGEGVNLQFAHIVVNWDLPWAPTRIEQRIGRVDRIGQTSPVYAFNLVLEDSVDLRVLEILEQKLETIEVELGADKRADILNSADHIVEDIFAQAIADPTELDRATQDLDTGLREAAKANQRVREWLGNSTHVPQQAEAAQLPHVMAVAADAMSAFFDRLHVDPAEAIRRIPLAAPGEPVPVVHAGFDGWLSVWMVTSVDREHEIGSYSVFRTENGRVDPHHAEKVWRALCQPASTSVIRSVTPDEKTWRAIHDQGRDFGFGPLKQLSRGVLSTPSVELALLVRVVA